MVSFEIEPDLKGGEGVFAGHTHNLAWAAEVDKYISVYNLCRPIGSSGWWSCHQPPMWAGTR